MHSIEVTLGNAPFDACPKMNELFSKLNLKSSFDKFFERWVDDITSYFEYPVKYTGTVII